MFLVAMVMVMEKEQQDEDTQAGRQTERERKKWISPEPQCLRIARKEGQSDQLTAWLFGRASTGEEIGESLGKPLTSRVGVIGGR